GTRLAVGRLLRQLARPPPTSPPCGPACLCTCSTTPMPPSPLDVGAPCGTSKTPWATPAPRTTRRHDRSRGQLDARPATPSPPTSPAALALRGEGCPGHPPGPGAG